MAGCPTLTSTKVLRSLGIAAAVIPLIGGQTSHSQQVTAPPAMPMPQTPPSGDAAPLVLKATVGAEKRLQSNGQMVAMVQGRTITLEFDQIDKTRITKVDKDGKVTVENTVESSQAKVGGQSIPDDAPSKDIDTITFDTDNSLVSYQSSDTDQDSLKRSVRLFSATQPLFANVPTKVGTQWSKTLKADAIPGMRDAKVDMMVMAIEPKQGVPCIRLGVRFLETSGSTPLQSEGILWIERSSGDKVAAEWNIRNLPLGDDTELVSGRVVETRISGGILASQNGGAAQDTSKPSTNPSLPVQAGPPKPDAKKIDELVKDFEKLPGLMTMYRKKDALSGRETVYLEIPDDQLSKWLLLQATASTGTSGYVELGEPIGDFAFQFQKLPDDRIAITVPNWTHIAPGDALTEKNVRAVYPDAIIQAYRVEAKQAERKSQLIDISELFKGDLLGVSAPFAPPPIPGLMGGPQGGAMGLDRDKTFMLSLKGLPENIVAITQYHFIRGQNRPVVGQSLVDSRSASYKVMYNLSALPVGNGYKPRLADPRIGYFTNEPYATASPMDFTREDKEDLTVRYIHRFDVRKKNPDAKVSEPVKPLVFWLDSGIPIEWRDAIRDGILEWNKAFVAIGLQNVIQVKQLPDVIPADAKDMPLDTGDARFNIVRWVTDDSLENAHAVAHARFNPLNGQVLSGSINITSSFVRVTQLEKMLSVDPAAAFSRVAESVPFADMLGSSKESLRCRLAEHGRMNAWLGLQAMEGGANRGPLSNREYVRQFLREAIAHETGHLLGLRHNFAASSQYTLGQLGNSTFVNTKGTSASVMDYTPFNIMALEDKDVPFFSPVIGPYDYWAIQYGYMDTKGIKDPADEVAILNQVARKSGQLGYRYQGDEAADSFDPTVTRFDLSSDPLAYWTKSLEMSEKLLAALPGRLPKYGRSYVEFTRSFGMIVNQIGQSTAQVSRFVGAQTVNRSFKGDVNAPAPLRPVPASVQKKAIATLHDYLFGPFALPIPAAALDKLQTRLDTFPATPGEYPIADSLSNVQKMGLRRLYSPQILSRVVNNAFKDEARKQPVLDLATYSELVGMPLWSEVLYGRSATAARRQLQRLHVETLSNFVLSGGGPDEMRMVASIQLQSLRLKLGKVNASKMDRMTKYHIADTVQRITRTLDAKVTISSGGGGGGLPPGLLQSLMGGKVLP